ncbi:hypothetical protein GCM10019059_44860 [Camelimonas fluminis]|nr:hypothetical protein GCM10019059_44860 [Camelimonas fluminis]
MGAQAVSLTAEHLGCFFIANLHPQLEYIAFKLQRDIHNSKISRVELNADMTDSSLRSPC